MRRFWLGGKKVTKILWKCTHTFIRQNRDDFRFSFVLFKMVEPRKHVCKVLLDGGGGGVWRRQNQKFSNT